MQKVSRSIFSSVVSVVDVITRPFVGAYRRAALRRASRQYLDDRKARRERQADQPTEEDEESR